MNEKISILAVDDNPENLKVIGGLLKEKGYRIALALDGKSALKVIKENKIDLILLDVMMPGMDGYEVCQKIKAQEEFKDIPIIFLTAKSEPDDVVKGFQLGGVDYITKPFITEELYARVNSHVQLKIARDLLKLHAEHYKESRDELILRLIEMGKLMGFK